MIKGVEYTSARGTWGMFFKDAREEVSRISKSPHCDELIIGSDVAPMYLTREQALVIMDYLKRFIDTGDPRDEV